MKIAKAIVVLPAVLVMNYLMGEQYPMQMALHHQSVLADVTTRVGVGVVRSPQKYIS